METPNTETAPEAAVPIVDDRDSILAEMEALTDEGETVEESEAQAEESADETTPEVEAATEGAEDVETPEVEVEIDSKKMAALQKEQKRHQEAADSRAGELDAREAALKTREEGLTAMDDLRARAAIDPVGVMEALGLKPDSFEDTARDFYNRRPDAKVDRHVAQRDIKLREANDSASQARDEVKALRAEIQQERDQRAVEQKFNTTMEGATKAVSDESPIVAKLLSANPSKFQTQVSETIVRLWRESGEEPDHIDVIRELENTKRTELLELGFELPSGSPKQPAQSPKKPVGKTLTTNLGTSTQTRDTDLSEEEEREDVLRGMSSLE